MHYRIETLPVTVTNYGLDFETPIGWQLHSMLGDAYHSELYDIASGETTHTVFVRVVLQSSY